MVIWPMWLDELRGGVPLLGGVGDLPDRLIDGGLPFRATVGRVRARPESGAFSDRDLRAAALTYVDAELEIALATNRHSSSVRVKELYVRWQT
jgi:hypothetical protein